MGRASFWRINDIQTFSKEMPCVLSRQHTDFRRILKETNLWWNGCLLVWYHFLLCIHNYYVIHIWMEGIKYRQFRYIFHMEIIPFLKDSFQYSHSRFRLWIGLRGSFRVQPRTRKLFIYPRWWIEGLRKKKITDKKNQKIYCLKMEKDASSSRMWLPSQDTTSFWRESIYFRW